MKSSRTILLSLTLAGAVALAGGCAKKDDAGSSPASSSAPSPTAAPKTELVASMTKLKQTSQTFTLKTDMGALSQVTGSGATDPATKSSQMKMTITGQGHSIDTEAITVGTDLWLKLGTPIPGLDPNKWTHIDATKAKSLSALGLSDPSDPTNIGKFGDAVVSAEKTGPGQYKGTIDLTKSSAAGVSSQVLGQMGDAAKAVPFEATVNGDGYVTALTIHMPASGTQVPASTTTMTFGDFGKAPAVKAPEKAQSQEAPQQLYSVLGGGTTTA
jgi:hypothetical protein